MSRPRVVPSTAASANPTATVSRLLASAPRSSPDAIIVTAALATALGYDRNSGLTRRPTNSHVLTTVIIDARRTGHNERGRRVVASSSTAGSSVGGVEMTVMAAPPRA